MTRNTHELADVTSRTMTADQLYVPEITLTVPKYADGILVCGPAYNKENPDIATSLVTLIDQKNSIRIGMLDGTPLQVYDYDHNNGNPERGLFARPIGYIALERASELWTTTNLLESDVTDVIGTKKFVDLVINIAAGKQLQMRREQQAAENLAFSSALQHLF